jgi:hypothetical protein
MAGLDPAIQALRFNNEDRIWMRGSSPRMTARLEMTAQFQSAFGTSSAKPANLPKFFRCSRVATSQRTPIMSR